jgi:hypothetical protein
MFTKLFFTLVVFGAAILFIKKRQADEERAEMPARNPPPPREISENEKLFRQGAWLFLILMVISAIGIVAFKIGDRYATVEVRIINTRSGEVRHYKARRDGIKSGYIITEDGRRIYLADIERMEVDKE